MPEASTRMSTPPNRFTAASTILSQFAAELGRMLTASTLAPRFSQSAATFFSASAPPAASTRLQPAPESTCAASAPNAPVAPVTIAVLPLTSNSESGFFRKSSDMTFTLCLSRHREVRAKRASKGDGLGAPAVSFEARAVRGHLRMTDYSLFHRRNRDRNRADLVAAVDNLAALVRADVNAVAGLGDRLLAAGDHRELAGQHVIDLLRRRSVGACAAARQKVRDAEHQRLRAAHLGAVDAERFVAAVVRRFVRPGFRKFSYDHQTFSPFSIR